MSRSVDLDWAIRREQQHRIYLQQVAATTAGFLERYQDILDDIQDQNLVQYVEREYNQARELLQEAFDLQNSNPEAARDVSRRVGAIVGGLPSLARSIRETAQIQARMQEREKMRKEREEYKRQKIVEMNQRSQFLSGLEDSIDNAFKDPVALDYAHNEIKVLKQKYETLAQQNSDFSDLERKFQSELTTIAHSASKKAEEWKAAKKAEQKKTVIVQQIQTCASVIDKKAATMGASKLKELTEKLKKMESSLDSGEVSAEVIEAEVQKIPDSVEQACFTEELRRHTLMSLGKTLYELGFLFPEGHPTVEGDLVKLLARRPNGQECTFYVKLDGGLHYSFDNYQGSACKKDLNQLLPKLEEVYGIKLSNERVIWENPDEIGKEAKDLPNGTQHGGF